MDDINWIATASVTVLAVFLTSAFINYNNNKTTSRWPKVPNALPIFGNALSLLDSDEFANTITEWSGLYGKKEGGFQFSLFRQRWIILSRSDYVMKALKLRPFKFHRAQIMDNAAKSLNADGLFTAEEDTWRRERRIIAPALNQKHMEDYLPSVKLVSKRLVEKWEEKDEVDASKDMSSCTLDVVGLAVLGVDIDSLRDPHSQLVRDIGDFFQFAFNRTLSPIPYWKIPIIGQHLDGALKTNNRLQATLRRLIHDCRARKEVEAKQDQAQAQAQEGNKEVQVEGNQNGKGNDTNESTSTKNGESFLRKMIDLSEGENSKLEDNRVLTNLLTLILAGTETSANTTSVALWKIANDPTLQEELYLEAKEVQSDLQDLTLSEFLPSFPRIRSLLYEVLRTQGPTKFMYFEPAERMEFAGEMVDPGTIIGVKLSCDPGESESVIPLGPNNIPVGEFCPRRWLVSHEKSNPHGSSLDVMEPMNSTGEYMSFGHGARICPGRRLAETEIVSFLAHILTKFEISVPANHPPLRMVSRFTETFDKDMRLTLKKRKE